MLKKLWHWFEGILGPLVTISILILMLTLIYEYAGPLFVGPLSEEEIHFLHDVEMVAIVILAVEIIIALWKAKDKKKYLFENWLMIVSLIPFASSVRLLKFLKIVRVQGGTALKLIKIWFHGSRVIRLARPIVFFYNKFKKKIGLKTKK
jgi:hypothetical protein